MLCEEMLRLWMVVVRVERRRQRRVFHPVTSWGPAFFLAWVGQTCPCRAARCELGGSRNGRRGAPGLGIARAEHRGSSPSGLLAVLSGLMVVWHGYQYSRQCRGIWISILVRASSWEILWSPDARRHCACICWIQYV